VRCSGELIEDEAVLEVWRGSSNLCPSLVPATKFLPACVCAWLQNVNMTDHERTKELLDRKHKSKLPVYRGYDDEDEESAMAGAPGGKRILSQYNEEEKKGPKLVLKGDEVPVVAKVPLPAKVVPLFRCWAGFRCDCARCVRLGTPMMTPRWSC
jgi:hypothetical protein